ncbi:unnamed protein product [Cryptosporidium hominis]|uniref:Ankyrin repeat containing protein n=2 Tax=Cryptosporidium hominis TaxID=237895 RepID=A0A0S4TFG1_CRYHO|nr:hypothetical protein ChTU502y2012_401g0305 [Cryptosporidium hominis]PPA65187.1 hypothetical protein ChUKH1_15875 [Cryptosporidium hominis]PPS93755.1 Ankyrin repeat containing protein [Cryptosporidium hominis]CUV05189.1 unnamed protein product [Cryptosporidium hominis]|eukprot:PPS93755.1 Ankyrin repeat containing protein [Cryptosporidium hominis]
MRNNFIDEDIFKIDDISSLIGSDTLLNSPCVVIQNVDYTPLQASLIHNSIKIRDFILKQNSIDINIQNSKGENVLITAIVNKAPLTFIKELFRRNIDICLPKDSKFSSIIDFADPNWEGYSELKHMLQRRKSYNFNYREQNSEKQIENKSKDVEKKETEQSDYSINTIQFGSELAEVDKKNSPDNNIFDLKSPNTMNIDDKNLNTIANYLEMVEGKNALEPINQITNKKNTSRSISKSIFIPKSVIKPNAHSSASESKKDTKVKNDTQESSSLKHESEIFSEPLEAEKKGEENKRNIVHMKNSTTNDEDNGIINNKDKLRSDGNKSSEIISEKMCNIKPSAKNTKPEFTIKKTTKSQDFNCDQRGGDYCKYIGIDDEYMSLIDQQLNESIETSKKLFSCACCAGIRPWKSET